MSKTFQLSVPRLTPRVKQLLIALFVAFVAQLILQNVLGVAVFEHLALWVGSTFDVAEPWRLLSYVWVEAIQPAAVLRLVLGLAFLWFILSPFEARYGARRTSQLCLLCALGGALGGVSAGFFLHRATPLYGTETLSLGGIAALSMAYRKSRVSLFGVLPLTAWQLIGGLVAYTLLVALASQNIAMLGASLGAIAAGVAFVTWFTRPRQDRPKKSRAGKTPHPFTVIEGDRKDPERWLN